MANEKPVAHYIDVPQLPDQFPTNRHDAEFWEALGRAVATFGFLEEILRKAIFAFTATRPYDEKAYDAWLPRLELALTGALGNLIDAYECAVRDHQGRTVTDLDDLVRQLRKASELRNVLCRGSWRPPDANGASELLYVDRKKRVFETAIDRGFLAQVQRHVAELACTVINTVTQMGWQFPGSNGLGKAI